MKAVVELPWAGCPRALLVAAGAALGLLVGESASAQTSGRGTAAGGSSIEEQIGVGLVPPVLVNGETPVLIPLAARMEELRVSAVSIAVIRHGKLEWTGGFGTRDQSGAPVTADTLFQAGSISKALTAVAVLRLAQDRGLDLDADVNRYLESWKVPQSSFTLGNPVTLRRLLSHSAGVTQGGFGGYEAGKPVPTLIQVLNGESPSRTPPIRVDLVPGTVWRYSGGGYLIVQQALVDITDTPFPQLMHEWVLAPMGMAQSSFEQPLAPNRYAQAAIPYDPDGAPLREGPHTYPEMAAAGLWTTSSDLARFGIEIQRVLGGDSGAVLPQRVGRELVSGAPKGLQVPFTRSQPGIGFIVGGQTERKYLYHPGGNAGYSGYLLIYGSGDGIAVLLNSSSGDSSRLTDDIVRTVAFAHGWPDFAPAQRTLAMIAPSSFDRHVGAYRSASGALLTLWRESDHLKARVWGESASEIFPSSDREYFSRASTRTWTVNEDGGAVTSVTLREQGGEQTFARLDEPVGRDAMERSVELDARIREQVPAPGGKRALLEAITGVRSGNPGYDRMTPELASLTRRELPGLQRILEGYGSVKSATFKRVRPDGLDVYEVMFEAGPRNLEILIAPDGRIHTLMFNR